MSKSDCKKVTRIRAYEIAPVIYLRRSSDELGAGGSSASNGLSVVLVNVNRSLLYELFSGLALSADLERQTVHVRTESGLAVGDVPSSRTTEVQGKGNSTPVITRIDPVVGLCEVQF